MTTSSPPIPTHRNKPQNNQFYDELIRSPSNSKHGSPSNSKLTSPSKISKNSGENSILANKKNISNNYDEIPIKPSDNDGYPSPSQFDDNFFPTSKRGKVANSPINKRSTPVKAKVNTSSHPSPAKSPTIQRKTPTKNENTANINLDRPIQRKNNFDDEFEMQPVDYDFSNLPPDAFQDAAAPREPEVTPRILSLSLIHHEQQKDVEKDYQFTFSKTKEEALTDYMNFIGAPVSKQIDSKMYRQRITGLNALQEKLEGVDDITQLSLPVFRGLEKSPGWNHTSSTVHLLVIDIIRHVIVKSKNIMKATISIIMPYLVEKLSDKNLIESIAELLNIIAEQICPSFAVYQICEIAATYKGSRPINPKTLGAALDICTTIIQDFGLGKISFPNVWPHVVKLLQMKQAEIKNATTKIAQYLYKQFQQEMSEKLTDLPSQVVDKLKPELEKAASLPNPTKKYCRGEFGTSSIARKSLLKSINIDDIENVPKAKWAEQKQFLDSVEKGLDDTNNNIISADLDPIFRVFKQFLSVNNKNLISKSLSLLELIAKASDKGIAKYVPAVAANIVPAWFDIRAPIREQATKTVDAFSVYSTVSPFIKAFVSVNAQMKANSDSRLEIVNWIQSHIDEIGQSDMEKIVPFILQCVEDKSSETRQAGVQIAVILRDMCPDAFDSAFKSLSNASQREISKHIDTTQQNRGNPKQPPSPKKRIDQKGPAANPQANEKQHRSSQGGNAPITKENDEFDKQQNTCIKFASIPTQGKKIKRLKQQQPNLGLSLIGSRQMIATVADKTKYDAQAIFPPSLIQKLFSIQVSDQLETLQELKQGFVTDPQSIIACSDILIRWLATKMFEKTVKILTEGLCLLMSIYAEDTISLQEMEIIVPLIFWGVDSKTPQVADYLYDFLFVIRTHSDPTEYSTVLRSCFDLCNDKSLVHLLIELQFTIIDDPRNPQIFIELIDFLDHRSVEVAAACGGVLALLARRIPSNVLLSIYNDISPDKKGAVSLIVPIESQTTVNFDNFNQSSSIEKIKTCRRLLELLSTKADSVQENYGQILDALIHELCCQETDFTAIKLVLFSVHSMLMFCSIKESDLNRTLQAVTFFGNRWQKKLVLMDGVSAAQTINSILFKLFEKIQPITLFSLLLEGMANYRGSVPTDSFYCKCWVAFSNQIEEMVQPKDSSAIIQFAKDKVLEFGLDDVRGKLCNALIYNLSEKKKEFAKQAKAQQTQSKRDSTAAATLKSFQYTIGKTPSSPSTNIKTTPTRQSATSTLNQHNSPEKKAATTTVNKPTEESQATQKRAPIESKFTISSLYQPKLQSSATTNKKQSTDSTSPTKRSQSKTSESSKRTADSGNLANTTATANSSSRVSGQAATTTTNSTTRKYGNQNSTDLMKTLAMLKTKFEPKQQKPQ